MGNSIKILENLINYAIKRHGVILSNIANVDTPQYSAKDLIFPKLVEDEKLKLITTDPKHLLNDVEVNLKEESIELIDENWEDKNNVELDKEVTKMTENSILYHTSLNMFSARIRMFKNALRRT